MAPNFTKFVEVDVHPQIDISDSCNGLMVVLPASVKINSISLLVPVELSIAGRQAGIFADCHEAREAT